jgi:hypothetical protein
LFKLTVRLAVFCPANCVVILPAIKSKVRVIPGGLDAPLQVVAASANCGRIRELVGSVVDPVVVLSVIPPLGAHDVIVAENASWSTTVTGTPQLSVAELTAVRLNDPWVVEFPETL